MGSQGYFPVFTGLVLVIGTGLLGASIGLGLRAAGVPGVYLQDISPTVEAVAEDIGAGTRWSSLGKPNARCRSWCWWWPRRTWLVTQVQALNTYAPHGLFGATVTDIASVKSCRCGRCLSRGLDASRYVGVAPDGGAEKSGPVAARGELF